MTSEKVEKNLFVAFILGKWLYCMEKTKIIFLKKIIDFMFYNGIIYNE
jgi:hypothetical protein